MSAGELINVGIICVVIPSQIYKKAKISSRLSKIHGLQARDRFDTHNTFQAQAFHFPKVSKTRFSISNYQPMVFDCAADVFIVWLQERPIQTCQAAK